MPGSNSSTKVFTTGQISKMCNVAPRTVSKWFDTGRLRGYRIPGSNDRRVPRENLIRFLKEHDMPLGELESAEASTLLLVGFSAVSQRGIRECVSEDECIVTEASCAFEAGIIIESERPNCVIIDFEMGFDESYSIVCSLRHRDEYARMVLIGLLANDSDIGRIDRALFSETFRKPLDANLLIERFRSLVDSERQRA